MFNQGYIIGGWTVGVLQFEESSQSSFKNRSAPNHASKNPPRERSHMFLAQVQHLKHLGEVHSSIWIIETQLLDNSRSLLLTHRDEAIQFNNLNLTHFDKNCQNHRHFDNFMPYVSGLGFRIGIGNLPVLRSNFGGEISTELGGITTSRATRCPCAKFGSDIQILSRIQPELFFFVLPCSCLTHVPWFSNTTEFCSFNWKSNHKFPMWFTNTMAWVRV